MHQVAVRTSESDINPSRQETESILNHSRQAWEASEPCRQLRETLAMATAPRNITKVVGFACGSLAAQDPQDRQAVRSATQHALLLTIQDILREPGRQAQIPCFVQDPGYTAVDKDVLGTSGITVLDDPMGFVEVDDESVLVSIHPNCPVKEIVHDLAKPALIIWEAAYDHTITPPV